jgi:hypothetical protein
MQAGLQIIVTPTKSGGMHVRVTPIDMDIPGAPRALPEVVSAPLDKSPHTDGPEALRLWVNSVARLVARTLEDDLYESQRVSARIPNSRGIYPY